MYGFPEITEAARQVEEAPDDGFARAGARLREILERVSAPEEPAPQTVLLVDDDPDIVELLTATLADQQWNLVSVGRLADVPAVLARAEVGLVLLDLVLPDGDGRELLRQLRQDRRTATLPVFVLSARLGESTRAECLRLGATSSFEKPFDVFALRTAVQSAIQGASGGPPAPVAAAPPAATASPGGPRRVLLAEDDELIAAVVRHRLEREGFEVVHFVDGALALESTADGAAALPVLVILDLKLPGMDGYEVLERMRALPGYAALPILILTSLDSEANLVRAFDLGATDYVVKPFSPAELVARVKRLTG